MKTVITIALLLSLSWAKDVVILVKFDSLQVDKSEFPLLTASSRQVDLNEENVILKGVLETFSPTSKPKEKESKKSSSTEVKAVPDIPKLTIGTPAIGFPGIPEVTIPEESEQNPPADSTTKR